VTFEFGIPYHGKTIAQCRAIGAHGGRERARNLRLRQPGRAPATVKTSPPEPETARLAIERIDRLCPWLRGCELRAV
jgi:hypothetical protein